MIQATIPQARYLFPEASNAALQEAQANLRKAVDNFGLELKHLLRLTGSYASGELNAIYWRRILPEVLMEAVSCTGATAGIAAALGFLKAVGFDVHSVGKSASRDGVWYEVHGDSVVCFALESPPGQPS